MTQETRDDAGQDARAVWTKRIVIAGVLLVLLLVAYFLGTTLVPRWWAHRIGNRVDGSITAGTLYGLFIGFVFTLVPLLVVRQAVRGFAWKVRAWLVLLALAIAIPNLLTLAIVVGNGNGAHAGDRVLDVEGPGFRAGSAWGAAIAALVAFAIIAWAWSWSRNRRRLKELKAEKQAAPQD